MGHQVLQGGLLGVAGLWGYRQIVKGDAVVAYQPAKILMVRGHGHNLNRQLPTLATKQQVIEAVPKLRDQNHHPRALAGRGHLPVHLH